MEPNHPRAESREPFTEMPRDIPVRSTHDRICHQKGKPMLTHGIMIETSEPRPYEVGGDPASIIKAEGVTPKDIDEHIVDVSKGIVEQESAGTDESSAAEDVNEQEVEPNSIEIAKALDGAVPIEDLHELEGMEMDEALGYAFTLLLENGIEDPEAYLIEKGILE